MRCVRSFLVLTITASSLFGSVKPAAAHHGGGGGGGFFGGGGGFFGGGGGHHVGGGGWGGFQGGNGGLFGGGGGRQHPGQGRVGSNSRVSVMPQVQTGISNQHRPAFKTFNSGEWTNNYGNQGNGSVNRSIIPNLIGTFTPPNSGNDGRPRYHQNYPSNNPGYYPNPAPTNVLSYQAPSNQAPANSAPVTPKQPSKNKLVRRNTPKPNGDVRKAAGFSLDGGGSAETDANQINDATVAQGEDAGDLTTTINAGPASTDPVFAGLPAPEQARVQADWATLQTGSMDSAAVNAFITAHPGDFGPDTLNKLNFLGILGDYKIGLMNGTLVGSDKTNALNNVATAAAGLPPGPLATSVAATVSDMQAQNTLGQLADLAAATDNPLGTIIAGANAGGFPMSIVSDMTGIPIMTQPPVADYAGVAQAATIVLMNPAETGQTVNYTLSDQHQYAMEAGHQQTLTESYVISFDTGSGQGENRYTLESGTYKWVIGSAGWDLTSVTFAVTIDNSQYGADFNYQLNDQSATVPAGQTREHKSPLPLEITFDRGDGGQPARKLLKSGRYKVGVDANEQRLDLFDSEAPVAATSNTVAPTVIATPISSRAARIQEALKKKVDRSGEVEKLLTRLKQGKASN